MSRQLPRLNPLRAFEAAARHLSFTRAAEELFVTPSAVSHQVKALILTAAGKAYLPGVQEAFRQLAFATYQLHRERSIPALKINLPPTFATKWLIPRMKRFVQANQDLDLKISTSKHMVDFAREDFDLAVRFGRGVYPGLRASPCSSWRAHESKCCAEGGGYPTRMQASSTTLPQRALTSCLRENAPEARAGKCEMKYKFILHTPLQVRDTPDGSCGRSEMAMRLVDFVPVLVTVRLPILLKRHDIGVPMAHTAQCSQLFSARSDRNHLPFEHHGLQAMVTVKMCVHAAHHQIVVTVLQVQHPVGNRMVVVIVDKAHAGHALTLVRTYVREGVTAQTLADQVTQCVLSASAPITSNTR